MECPRCCGRMNYEFFMDGGERSIPWSYDGWRCVYCGEVVDPIILLNRSRHVQRLEAVARSARAGRRLRASA